MTKTDIDYIESAYSDAIGVLFKQLFTGIDTQPEKEKEFLEHFSTGLAAAKKAKELALSVVKPASSINMEAKIARKRNRSLASS
jgi:hypothetical protein